MSRQVIPYSSTSSLKRSTVDCRKTSSGRIVTVVFFAPCILLRTYLVDQSRMNADVLMVCRRREWNRTEGVADQRRVRLDMLTLIILRKLYEILRHRAPPARRTRPVLAPAVVQDETQLRSRGVFIPFTTSQRRAAVASPRHRAHYSKIWRHP